MLAVGTFKSWRTALLATLAALGVLLALVAVFGFAITASVSISAARTVVGVGLLLFGLGWSYKAILRSAGLKAQRDEAAEYEETKEEVMTHGRAFGTAFGGVFLEGLEVVFIVVAFGGLNSLPAATAGALLALVVVVAAGAALRKPLTRVPENLVKHAVGVMLTSFGTFFAGEGLGVSWWRGDLVLLFLVAGYAAATLIFVRLLQWRPVDIVNATPVRWLRSAVVEVWSLFVTDGVLASLVLGALLGVWWFMSRAHGGTTNAGLLLVAGIVVSLGVALWSAAQRAAAAAPTAPVPKEPEASRQGSEAG